MTALVDSIGGKAVSGFARNCFPSIHFYLMEELRGADVLPAIPDFLPPVSVGDSIDGFCLYFYLAEELRVADFFLAARDYHPAASSGDSLDLLRLYFYFMEELQGADFHSAVRDFVSGSFGRAFFLIQYPNILYLITLWRLSIQPWIDRRMFCILVAGSDKLVSTSQDFVIKNHSI